MLDRHAHTASLIVAAFAGFMTAVREPATAQFEQLTRALDLTGPLLAPLSMLYATAITLAVMAVAYALLSLLWQHLAHWRQAGGSHSGPSS